MKEISVSLGRTYNIGNYESVRLDVGCKLEVHSDPDELLAEGWDWCEEALAKLEEKAGVDDK